jgi:hypothetical protein
MWRLNNDKKKMSRLEDPLMVFQISIINSFYYSTGNHTQRRFQLDDLSLMAHYKVLTRSY